jgi:hypothetical protein
VGYDMGVNEVMTVEECRDLAACNAVTRSMSNSRETEVSKNLCGLFFKEVILSEDAKSFAELQREDYWLLVTGVLSKTGVSYSRIDSKAGDKAESLFKSPYTSQKAIQT